MYVNKAICESFTAINIQMFARIIKLSNRAKVALCTYIVLGAGFSFRSTIYKQIKITIYENLRFFKSKTIN